MSLFFFALPRRKKIRRSTSLIIFALGCISGELSPLRETATSSRSIFVRSFVPPPVIPPSRLPHRTVSSGTASSTSLAAERGELSVPKAPIIDESLYDAAEAKLQWEIQAEKEERPLLDLSGLGRENESLSLSEAASVATSEATGASSSVKEEDGGSEEGDQPSWRDGSVWAKTRATLVNLWVLPRDMSSGASAEYATAASRGEIRALESAPQLLRLPTELVVGSAKAVLEAHLPPALLRSEPILMTYPPEFITGGLEFLTTMMMTTPKMAVAVCRDTPGLLVTSIEGYAQEQATARALGDAGKATYGVNKQIAGEKAAVLKSMKDKNEGLLG